MDVSRGKRIYFLVANGPSEAIPSINFDFAKENNYHLRKGQEYEESNSAKAGLPFWLEEEVAITLGA